MELDLTKLGKLIEKCQSAGVTRLSLGDGVEVQFFNRAYPDGEYTTAVSDPLDAAKPPLAAPEPIQLSEEQLEALREEEKQFDEEMLHITDPAAWQQSLLDPNEEDSVTTGGDETELSHVQ